MIISGNFISAVSGKQDGLTLVELLISLSIFSLILVSLVMPGAAFFKSIKYVADTQSLVQDLFHARLMARIKSVPVYVEFDDRSYKVFAQAEEYMRRQTAFEFSGKDKISFSTTGLPFTAATVYLTQNNGKQRKLILSRMGRIRIE